MLSFDNKFIDNAKAIEVCLVLHVHWLLEMYWKCYKEIQKQVS
jgi:hypothetical protein